MRRPPQSSPAPDQPPAPSEGEAGLGPYGSWPYVERRVTPDRRERRTPLLSLGHRRGRRVGGRRRDERRNVYVDVYHPRDVALAVAILGLNILDAVLTLIYVQDDISREANPFARYLIELGVGWFMFSKAAVVALCVLFLTMHKTFRLVRPALYFLLAFYTALLGYHLYLQLGPGVGAALD